MDRKAYTLFKTPDHICNDWIRPKDEKEVTFYSNLKCSGNECMYWLHNMECPSTCKNPTCENQQFAKKFQQKIQTYIKKDKTGYGVSATEDIHILQFVAEYLGIVTPTKMFDKGLDLKTGMYQNFHVLDPKGTMIVHTYFRGSTGM